ncbi:hypothetical protein [Pseudomonas taiwanensis]|uniref:Uncharacterized protein n=1 Tax=Pseudomonas taiwanensis TaxID=470150 RepID=A0ABR6V6L3_9PSED|nr:hypothetical protein [Pseudomonas taiwanensis]MBC3476149.1 hypothetical protein [Pseudomonas taiwanensis]MDT8927035.1 hypothetical protein [Pseudomonas taiwanensis]
MWPISAEPPVYGRAKHFADEPGALQPVLKRYELKTTSHPVTVCRKGRDAARQIRAIGRLGEILKFFAEISLTGLQMSQILLEAASLAAFSSFFGSPEQFAVLRQIIISVGVKNN